MFIQIINEQWKNKSWPIGASVHAASWRLRSQTLWLQNIKTVNWICILVQWLGCRQAWHSMIISVLLLNLLEHHESFSNSFVTNSNVFFMVVILNSKWPPSTKLHMTLRHWLLLSPFIECVLLYQHGQLEGESIFVFLSPQSDLLVSYNFKSAVKIYWFMLQINITNNSFMWKNILRCIQSIVFWMEFASWWIIQCTIQYMISSGCGISYSYLMIQSIIVSVKFIGKHQEPSLTRNTLIESAVCGIFYSKAHPCFGILTCTCIRCRLVWSDSWG